VRAVGVLVAALALSGCSLFGDDDEPTGVPVLQAEVGQCFRVPEGEPTVELTELPSVGCTQPHEQELYAAVEYVDPGTDPAAQDFPGAAALKTFAEGQCAERFADYVGVDYRDSRLFFTYLVPSARGWEKGGDRTTLCFVTTTGQQLTRSVAGTGW
jgi:hypothetical protein